MSAKFPRGGGGGGKLFLSHPSIRFSRAILIFLGILTFYLIEMPFKAFANRADPDQAALVRAA